VGIRRWWCNSPSFQLTTTVIPCWPPLLLHPQPSHPPSHPHAAHATHIPSLPQPPTTACLPSEGPTDVCLRAPGEAAPYSQTQPGLLVASPRLGHALWELYLDPKCPAPDARKAWLAAVPALGAS